MSSASQLLHGSIQGRDRETPAFIVNDFATKVLEDSPVLYWDMADYSGGAPTDSSGNGFDATATANLSLGPALRTNGTASMAVDSTSAISYALTDSVSGILDITDSFNWSVETVLRMDPTASFGTGNGFYVSSVKDLTGGDLPFKMINNKGLRTQFRGQAELSGVTYTTQLDGAVDNTAKHIVLVRDGSVLELYINGVSVDTVTGLPAVTNPVSTYPLMIGVNEAPSTFGAKFDISDCALYDYSISSTRIMEHYNTTGIT